jgi:hypothetical protein
MVSVCRQTLAASMTEKITAGPWPLHARSEQQREPCRPHILRYQGLAKARHAPKHTVSWQVAADAPSNRDRLRALLRQARYLTLTHRTPLFHQNAFKCDCTALPINTRQSGHQPNTIHHHTRSTAQQTALPHMKDPDQCFCLQQCKPGGPARTSPKVPASQGSWRHELHHHVALRMHSA